MKKFRLLGIIRIGRR